MKWWADYWGVALLAIVLTLILFAGIADLSLTVGKLYYELAELRHVVAR